MAGRVWRLAAYPLREEGSCVSNPVRKEHVGQLVTVCGWVQMSRDMNHFAFVDLRDRYGITQAMLKKLG